VPAYQVIGPKVNPQYCQTKQNKKTQKTKQRRKRKRKESKEMNWKASSYRRPSGYQLNSQHGIHLCLGLGL
jgi:hypothetical protein